MKVQLEVIKGAMISLASGSASGSLSSLGLQESDLKLVTGDIPWAANQRTSVTRTLDSLMFGTMDILGLPRFMVPAEYVAAVIVMFVHPSNLLVACRYMESGNPTADALGNPSNSSGNKEVVDATQLFSLCCQLADNSIVATCRSQFENRTKLSIVAQIPKKGVKNA